MKTILFYFLLAILVVSCQLKQSENTEKEVSDNVSNSDTEECIADTISATAIFWIDKADMCNRVNSSFSFVAYMGKSKQSKTPLLFQQGTISSDRSDLVFRALETPVPRLETVVSYAGNCNFP